MRDWADIFVIAPLSANTLAKLSNGLCDNLLTCVARAWKGNIFVAPAMNTGMYNHPITKKQLSILMEYGYLIINPIEKMLACGEFGLGAMENPKMIVDFVYDFVSSK